MCSITRRYSIVIFFLLTCVSVPLLAQIPKNPKKEYKTKIQIPFKQRFINSLGAGGYFYRSSGEEGIAYALNVAPHVNLFTFFSTDFSVSLGTQLAMGQHFKSGTGNDTTSFLFGDLPILAEINIGHLATKDFHSYMGFFIGGGYDASLLKNSLYTGAIISAGLRTWMFGNSITIRYQHIFSEYAVNAITLDINLGKYLKAVRKNNVISNFMSPYRK